MHVLHQPHRLRTAVMAALAAAILAIALTLAIAPGLNDLGSTPAPAGAATSSAAVSTSAFSLPSGNPFAPGSLPGPFTTPTRLPWAPVGR